MTNRLQFLLMLTFAWIGWAAVGGSLDRKQQAWAQPPDHSSRPDGETREERRERYRRSFGERGDDRGYRDWRGGRSRGEDRSSRGSSSSTNSGSASSSSHTSSSSSSTSSTSSSTAGASSSLDAHKWAVSLVKQNDKNGDMILEPDEQASLGSSASAEDLNHDGVITVDELVMYRNGGANASSRSASTGGSSAAGSDSGRSAGRERFSRFGYGRRDRDSGSDSHSTSNSDATAGRVLTGSAGKADDKRHSYRFTAASDRKPELPSELRSLDTNGDGQVSMSEFSHYWSSSTVAEFRRWDLNNDGIITPKEAAKRK